MMEGKAAALDRWFEERIALCAQRRQALLADDRGAEATFEKVRANVYDIFRTVLSAAGKASEGEEAAGRFFLRRLESIPSGWKASYEKARAHDDPVKLLIERIKLDAVREIQEEFLRVWGEAE